MNGRKDNLVSMDQQQIFSQLNILTGSGSKKVPQCSN